MKIQPKRPTYVCWRQIPPRDGRCVQEPVSIHRSMMISDYQRFLLHVFVLQKTIRTLITFKRFAQIHIFASHCNNLCSTYVAQSIQAITTRRPPHPPPISHRQSNMTYPFYKRYINIYTGITPVQEVNLTSQNTS